MFRRALSSSSESPAFAAPASVEPSRPADDIDLELLDLIPDLAPDAPAPPAPAGPRWSDAAPAPPEAAVATIVASMRQEMQGLVAREVDRVSSTLAAMVAEADARAKAAQAEAETLRRENAKLRHAQERHERAWKALRELTADDAPGGREG